MPNAPKDLPSKELPPKELPPKDLPPIPGLDIVGHGIYLRPYHPYEPRQALFPRDKMRPCSIKDAPQGFHIPEAYNLEDSPPMPSNQLLNQVMIEESWDRFDKQLRLDTNLAVSNGPFSISVGASSVNQMRSEQEAYYAVRSSFIPLWSVYVSGAAAPIPGLDEFDIPTPFSHSQRRVYEAFFARFGSHYVKRAWVGGKAMVFFTVLKSSQLSKDDIQAGIKASFGVAGQGEANRHLTESRERLVKNSQCSVIGKGGDELKLAALTTLDEARYNEWIDTIRDNPQTIELEVAGLWTLLKNPDKAKALADAYEAANVFSPINAAFTADKTVYCIRGRRYFCYHIEKYESEKPKLLVERWLELSNIGFDRVDAAFTGKDLVDHEGQSLGGKAFMFYHDKYVRIDLATNKLDGPPRPFAEDWPGVTFERIDATLAVGADAVYFFSGNRYIRFNTIKRCADEGYPQSISKRWVGVTFDRIDAAIYWGNGKVYFFREDQYIRYDTVIYRADPGYPKALLGDYVEDWQFFD